MIEPRYAVFIFGANFTDLYPKASIPPSPPTQQRELTESEVTDLLAGTLDFTTDTSDPADIYGVMASVSIVPDVGLANQLIENAPPEASHQIFVVLNRLGTGDVQYDYKIAVSPDEQEAILAAVDFTPSDSTPSPVLDAQVLAKLIELRTPSA